MEEEVWQDGGGVKTFGALSYCMSRAGNDDYYEEKGKEEDK